MLTAKICTSAAVLHLLCAVLMIFTDSRSRWGFRNLEPPPPDPTQIALGAIGINAKLQAKVVATRQKLAAADRQVATGFAVLAYLAQVGVLVIVATAPVQHVLHLWLQYLQFEFAGINVEFFLEQWIFEAFTSELMLLLWHGNSALATGASRMLFFSYVSPMALLWSSELPTLSLQECLFVAVVAWRCLLEFHVFFPRGSMLGRALG
ncbi:unnamed protein product [Symbiodinium natans]|uniref:Uncharacterized protein n=1 Tax=Symbiodinium natans TaxID=878477 RepID=A0A812S0K6_9DINO|nr:unnamed protein product [Symbiodinium natans]